MFSEIDGPTGTNTDSRLLTSLLRKPLFLALLLGLTVIAYANTFNTPFVFDDIYQIAENENLHMTRLSWDQVTHATEGKALLRPLSAITMAFNYYFGGTDPIGYHLVNLFIHLSTGIFLFFLIILTFQVGGFSRQIHFMGEASEVSDQIYLIAFFGVLFWLLSPVQTNAVTYIIQRMTSLAVMFFILTLLLYVKGRIKLRLEHTKTATAYFAGSFFCMLCAISSKEIAGTLPFVILLYEWFFFQNLRSLKSKKGFLLCVIALIIFFAIAYTYLGPHPVKKILRSYGQWEFTPKERLFTEFRVIAYYLSLIVFPHPKRLNLDHDYPLSETLISPMTTGMAAVMIISLLLMTIYTARKYRLLSFCLLWFLVNLAIESSIIGIEIIYEHRLYLPSIALYLAAVVLAYRYIPQKWISLTVLSIIALLLCSWTYQRNQVWTNNVALWTDCALKSPRKARPWQNLGYSFSKNHNFAEAARYYQKSLEIEKDADTYYKRGYALRQLGHHVSAVEALLSALEMDYRKNGIQSQLAYEFAAIGEFKKSLKYYRSAVEQDPADRTARNNLHSLLNFVQKCQKPTPCVKQGIQKNPDNPALYFKLGTLYESKGQLEKASTAYKKTLKMVSEKKNADPKLHLLAITRLAITYTKSGKVSRAMDAYLKGIQLEPENSDLYYEIAALHAYQDNPQKAINWLKRAVDKGFENWRHLSSDTRFKDIRTDDQYKELIYKIKN